MNILEAFRRMRTRRKYSKLMQSSSKLMSPGLMQAVLDAVEHP